VFYLFTGLAGCSVSPGISCDAHKLVRIPGLPKKKIATIKSSGLLSIMDLRFSFNSAPNHRPPSKKKKQKKIARFVTTPQHLVYLENHFSSIYTRLLFPMLSCFMDFKKSNIKKNSLALLFKFVFFINVVFELAYSHLD
jgi:hypothetical protein